MATAFSDQNSLMTSLNGIFLNETETAILNDFLQSTLESSKVPDNKNDGSIRNGSVLRLAEDFNFGQVSDCTMQVQPFKKTDISLNKNLCEHHVNEVIAFFCNTCSLPICRLCAIGEHIVHNFIHLDDAFDHLHKAGLKLLADTKVAALAVKDSYETTQKMLKAVNARVESVTREIHDYTAKFCTLIKEREANLLQLVETVRQNKVAVLRNQSEGLKDALSRFKATAAQLTNAIEYGTSLDLCKAKAKTINDIAQLIRCTRLSLSPQEDDVITFAAPDAQLLLAVSSFGNVSSKSFNNCSVLVENFICEPRHRLTTKIDFNKYALNELSNDMLVQRRLLGDNKNLLSDADLYYLKVNPCSSQSRSDYFRSRQIPAIQSCVCIARKFNNRNNATLAFSKEGDGDGELCRPWGVCCDKEGNIIVADRSNNRIQVFRSDGTFLFKFGVRGSEHGQFDRPAGVAVDPFGHIVVTDKDNHRIQVFTSQGHFIFTFGDKGSKAGQFNYPWDVDVNSEGIIVVSDTRNHRIQLFSPDGSFINKYGFEINSTMWKHFDSPRGVCFGQNSSIFVTDFNNHRIVVVEKNCEKARFIGSEGQASKQFLRPQGIAVDHDGHIIVADSRNNRIQVIHHESVFSWQFGTAGKELGQLDRPSGVCVAPDGRIIVVDFGNNRVQIF